MSAEDRFAERRRADRRRTWRRVAMGVVPVLVAAGVVWMVWFSDLLAVRSVDVTGHTSLEATEIREVAAVPLGRPLIRADLTAIEERVRSLTRVESVEATRSWPRTVSIEVIERTAVAWIGIDGQIRGVDRFGVEFRTFDEQPELVEIQVSTTDPRRRQQSFEGLGEVIEALRGSDQEFLDQVQVASAESQDSIRFTLGDGRTVVWGNAENFEDKLTVLRALLTSVEAREYDVSAPEQPTTRD